jgi:hypothetical protein
MTPLDRDLVVHQLKDHALARSLSVRAVKCCPWCPGLWGLAMREAERGDAGNEAMDALAQRALEGLAANAEDCLVILQAHLDYSRRRALGALARGAAEAEVEGLRGAFAYAETWLSSMYPGWEAADLAIRKYHAWALGQAAGVAGEEEKEALEAEARGVWDALLASSLGQYLSTWTDYVAWCKARGWSASAQLEKAVHAVADYPEVRPRVRVRDTSFNCAYYIEGAGVCGTSFCELVLITYTGQGHKSEPAALRMPH